MLVAHNELGHDENEPAHEGDEDLCPLYPGLRCRDHLNISVDADNSREANLPSVPFVALCPNSWLIAPSGGFPNRGATTESAPTTGATPEDAPTEPPAAKPDDKYAAARQIPEKEQFTAKGIRTHTDALQKILGDPLDRGAFHKVQTLWAEASKLEEEGDWSGVLLTLAKLEKHVKKAPLSLQRLVAERLVDVNDGLESTFEDLQDDKNVPAARALAKLAATKVLGHGLPIHQVMTRWLATQPK